MKSALSGLAIIALGALAGLGCAPALSGVRPAESIPLTVPSGYGGDTGLAELGPGRVLFANGRIGTGAGTEIGPRTEGRILTLVQRLGEGWTVCGLDQISSSYFAHGRGRLFCMVVEGPDSAPVERVFGGRGFSQPVDLVVGAQTSVLAQDGRGRLTRLDFRGRQPSRRWALPDPRNIRAGFIVDEDRVAAVYRTGEGCSLHTFRPSVGGDVPVSRREVDANLCQFQDFRVLRDEGGGAWLYAWTILTSALYDLTDGEPRLVDAVRLSAPSIGPGPITVVGGIIHFDAGSSPNRVALIGSYDPRTRALATVEAERRPGLEGPPRVLGLMPSFDGGLSVLVRSGAWATYRFGAPGSEDGKPD